MVKIMPVDEPRIAQLYLEKEGVPITENTGVYQMTQRDKVLGYGIYKVVDGVLHLIKIVLKEEDLGLYDGMARAIMANHMDQGIQTVTLEESVDFSKARAIGLLQGDKVQGIDIENFIINCKKCAKEKE